ncbi:hypothetical protein [Clostridium sp.]|uniref:hypothetical protein n=1 Tax=Clostridium sp. TaxID=1506 RepID=UPI0039F5D2F9
MNKKKVSAIMAALLTTGNLVSISAFAKPISNILTVDVTVNTASTTANPINAEELKKALADKNIEVINLSPTGNYEGQFEIRRNVTINGNGALIKAPDVLEAKGDKKPIIYVTGAEDVNIKNLKVDGNSKVTVTDGFTGISLENAGGTIEAVEVTNIKEKNLTGNQHGWGIYVNNMDKALRKVNITKCTVTAYQKDGIHVKGEGLTANVIDNILMGAGATDVIAQNGIVFEDKVIGKATGNTITKHNYIGDDDSAGVLLDGAGAVEVSKNKYDENKIDYLNNDIENTVTLSGTVDGVDFSASSIDIKKNPGESASIVISAKINDKNADAFGRNGQPADLILNLGANASKAVVKANGIEIKDADNDGKFDIGDIDGNTTEAFNIDITFNEAETYTAEIYVDDNR